MARIPLIEEAEHPELAEVIGRIKAGRRGADIDYVSGNVAAAGLQLSDLCRVGFENRFCRCVRSDGMRGFPLLVIDTAGREADNNLLLAGQFPILITDTHQSHYMVPPKEFVSMR